MTRDDRGLPPGQFPGDRSGGAAEGCKAQRAGSLPPLASRSSLFFVPEEDAIGPIERGLRVNEQIRISPVRVINAEGVMLGVMPTSKALEAAREAGLDLVEVAPNERPPVCKIIDYGKFKYTQKKRLSKQKQHQVHIKEIRVRPKTGDHDIEVKVKRAREFLEQKDKVLVNVLFRGRELAHIDEGRRVMQEVCRARRSRQGREEALDGGEADDGDRRATGLVGGAAEVRQTTKRPRKTSRPCRWPPVSVSICAATVVVPRQAHVEMVCYIRARSVHEHDRQDKRLKRAVPRPYYSERQSNEQTRPY